ncbi:hypothetical protein ACFU8Q_38875, partial [Streptomyces sp. NPDC057543]
MGEKEQEDVDAGRGDRDQGRRYAVWDDYADTATLRNDRGRFISAATKTIATGEAAPGVPLHQRRRAT